MPTPNPRSVRPPLQERSRQTLEDLGDAARSVLREKTFDEASLTEICREAGVTVGAFYARFPDKEALFVHLEHELYDAAVSAIREALGDAGDLPLDALLERVVVKVFEFNRVHQGVGQAVRLRARLDPEVGERLATVNRRLAGEATEVLLRHYGDRFRHPDPERALSVAFTLMLGTMREAMTPNSARLHGLLPDDVLARELARAITAYLTTRHP